MENKPTVVTLEPYNIMLNGYVVSSGDQACHVTLAAIFFWCHRSLHIDDKLP